MYINIYIYICVHNRVQRQVAAAGVLHQHQGLLPYNIEYIVLW